HQPSGGGDMDQAQARALLAAERTRLQRLLQAETSRPQAAELGDEGDDADPRKAEESGIAPARHGGRRPGGPRRALPPAATAGRSAAAGQSPTRGWRPTRWPS